MQFFELLACDMGIDLGGGYIDMAQHYLNSPQVRPAFQQVTGKRMPQTVGGDLFVKVGF
jgi:hypothetical protein